MSDHPAFFVLPFAVYSDHIAYRSTLVNRGVIIEQPSEI